MPEGAVAGDRRRVRLGQDDRRPDARRARAPRRPARSSPADATARCRRAPRASAAAAAARSRSSSRTRTRASTRGSRARGPIDEVLRLHRGDRRGARGARIARARRPGRPRRAADPRPAARAVRRPAPAGGDRTRPGRRAAGPHPRRVGRGARRLDPGPGAQPACRHPRRDAACRYVLICHDLAVVRQLTDEASSCTADASSSAVRPRRCSTPRATSTRSCCAPASPGPGGRLGGHVVDDVAR